MKEVSGAVVGIVLVLLAVFIPTAFIGGITGQLYKQFALTIAISTVISGFNAVSYTHLDVYKRQMPYRHIINHSNNWMQTGLLCRKLN